MDKAGNIKQSGDNYAVLKQLLEIGGIDIQSAPFLDNPPVPSNIPITFDRFKAMMLGPAIGDSLGNTSEGMLPGARRERFWEIRDYLPSTFSVKFTWDIK